MFVALIWLIGTILGKRTPKSQVLVDPKMTEEARARAAAWQAAFDEKYKKWIEEALALLVGGLGFLGDGEKVLGFPSRAKTSGGGRWRLARKDVEKVRPHMAAAGAST